MAAFFAIRRAFLPPRRDRKEALSGEPGEGVMPRKKDSLERVSVYWTQSLPQSVCCFEFFGLNGPVSNAETEPRAEAVVLLEHWEAQKEPAERRDCVEATERRSSFRQSQSGSSHPSAERAVHLEFSERKDWRLPIVISLFIGAVFFLFILRSAAVISRYSGPSCCGP